MPGAEECSLAFHEGRSLTALTWVAQQPRQGATRSRADEEADQLAEVASVYAERCEHVLGPCDRVPGANGAPGAGFGGRSSECGSQADDGFMLLQVRVRERPRPYERFQDVVEDCGMYTSATTFVFVQPLLCVNFHSPLVFVVGQIFFDRLIRKHFRRRIAILT